jgi:hypothetical protein
MPKAGGIIFKKPDMRGKPTFLNAIWYHACLTEQKFLLPVLTGTGEERCFLCVIPGVAEGE